MNKNIVIIGCGEAGSKTAMKLSDAGYFVYVVDQDTTAFENLGQSFSGFTIEKEISDLPGLQNGITEEKIDILLVLTGNDDTNIFISILAKDILKIENVSTRLYNEEKKFLLEEKNIDVFFPSLLPVQTLKKYLHKLGDI